MDLTQVFSSISQKAGSESKTGEKLLAVKISSHEASAATWQIVGGKVELGKISQAEVKGEEFADLLSCADQAISAVTENDKDSKNPVEKVIFGLPFHWVVDGKIVEDKLSLLQKLCQELDLKPLGYVLLSEALENYYKETEGAPLTAILLEFDKESGLLTMYRAGNNLGTAAIKADAETITSELEKALKKFTQAEVLPSRIIIYDNQRNLEVIAQSITAFPWTKNLPFLHFPKVEIFASGEVVKAVAVAGAVQMGGHFELDSAASVAKEEPKTERQAQEEHQIELEEVSAQEAGFMPGDQFTGMEIPFAQEPLAVERENFGQLQEMVPQQEAIAGLQENTSTPATVFVEKTSAIVQKVGTLGKKALSFVKSHLPLTPPDSSGQDGSARRKRMVLVAVFAVVAFLLVFGVVVYAVPQVKIILHFSAPPFDKEANIIVVTDRSGSSATDSAKTILGTLLEVSEVGTQKGVTTGRKLVGDRAKGTVTIYGAAASRSFPAGTIVASGDGLKFTLDRDAQVASASDFLSPATVSVPVTAVDIGDKYNLPANARFSVGTLSTQSYLAKNDTAFIGGNSHEATVVAKEDQARLAATLAAQLTQKAKDDLEAKLAPGQKLLPNAITSSVSKKKFSKDVGAEAETVSLDLTMDFSGVVFSESDLVAVFSRSFQGNIPAGFILSSDRANVEIKDVKIDKQGNTILTVRLTNGLVPQIDLTKTVGEVAGKSSSMASAHLLKIPGVTSVTMETKPRFLENTVKLFLPWKKDNLKIEVVSE